MAGGFDFLEGPVWRPSDRTLLFSDIPGDTRYRWTAERGVEVDQAPTNKANGLALDLQGRLLSCEHATSMLVRYEDGQRVALASHYEGRGLNSPNDVVVARDGSIWFTDPPYGRGDTTHGVGRRQELAFQGVFRLPAGGGEPELLTDDFARPNGLCFDLEERVLFVDDTERMHIRRFGIDPDGSVTGGEVFFTQEGDDRPGFPDGMKLDEEGNLWLCGPGGIWVVSPDADLLGIVEVPEVAANLCFAGDDRRDLFITASTGLYRLRTAVAGAPSPRERAS